MTHQHGETGHALHLAGPVAVVACLASAAVALFHLRLLVRAASHRGQWFLPAETGHVAVAAGMAVMFAGPLWMTSSALFAAAYLGLALAVLVLLLVHPVCRIPSLWSSCSMLVVEALAMAYMSGAGGRPVGDLTGWFVVVFAGAGLAAVGGLLVRRVAPAWAGAAPVAPVGTRLVMYAGMMLMLVY
ncbi:DUF5134 domain-containing protein [Candidatus Protofrankia californiensis]|uniref:DUF5134 domain-containing protein n=1 Tax=Candidatus Protofrankia californiensis TaxID=1839754 RepID=UPI00104178B8|nr:DUF5134 domain-containing protein [Candidatus Protofrankia californiensis]